MTANRPFAALESESDCIPSSVAKAVAVRRALPLPLDGGLVPDLVSFTGFDPPAEHFALRFGPMDAMDDAPLVRIHSECITGDLLRSQRCDCGAQLQESIARLGREGGLLLYLRQEGRGIGLYAKIEAYRLQDQGLDTFAANERLSLPRDARDFGCAAAMLRALGVRRLRLLTNNPEKCRHLAERGLEIVEVLGTGVYATPHNRDYLEAKRRIGGHALRLPGA
jgi:GTP cyclohydrolase II